MPFRVTSRCTNGDAATKEILTRDTDTSMFNGVNHILRRGGADSDRATLVLGEIGETPQARGGCNALLVQRLDSALSGAGLALLHLSFSFLPPTTTAC